MTSNAASDSGLSTRRLLLVEDESHLAAGLKLNFELEGFEVDVAESAQQAAKHLIDASRYDVIVLDVMLPDLDGFSLCKRIRDSGNFTPVIMLTARSSPNDRVRGLEAGADDYVSKPFELDELLARIRSTIRRQTWESSNATQKNDSLPSVVRLGKAEINFESHEVRIDGAPVRLTQLELSLLRYFVNHSGRVLSREELLENVWQLKNYPNTRTVDNFVMQLRRHFEPDPAKPRYFVSIRGAGYRFFPQAKN